MACGPRIRSASRQSQVLARAARLRTRNDPLSAGGGAGDSRQSPPPRRLNGIPNGIPPQASLRSQPPPLAPANTRHWLPAPGSLPCRSRIPPVRISDPSRAGDPAAHRLVACHLQRRPLHSGHRRAGQLRPGLRRGCEAERLRAILPRRSQALRVLGPIAMERCVLARRAVMELFAMGRCVLARRAVMGLCWGFLTSVTRPGRRTVAVIGTWCDDWWPRMHSHGQVRVSVRLLGRVALGRTATHYHCGVDMGPCSVVHVRHLHRGFAGHDAYADCGTTH